MTASSPDEVAILFQAWQQGDQEAFNRLHEIVYAELHRRAQSYMRKERPDHTLQTTALINEAYVRLLERTPEEILSRSEFFAIAANLMRQVLVDYARRGGEQKRRGGKISLEDALLLASPENPDILALNEALERLAELDPALVQLVELRYFAGFTIDETATILQTSRDVVNRQWNKAKTWLHHELNNPG